MPAAFLTSSVSKAALASSRNLCRSFILSPNSPVSGSLFWYSGFLWVMAVSKTMVLNINPAELECVLTDIYAAAMKAVAAETIANTAARVAILLSDQKMPW